MVAIRPTMKDKGIASKSPDLPQPRMSLMDLLAERPTMKDKGRASNHNKYTSTNRTGKFISRSKSSESKHCSPKAHRKSKSLDIECKSTPRVMALTADNCELILIALPSEELELFQRCHDYIGHCGIKMASKTYDKKRKNPGSSFRFHIEDIQRKFDNHVKACERCSLAKIVSSFCARKEFKVLVYPANTFLVIDFTSICRYDMKPAYKEKVNFIVGVEPFSRFYYAQIVQNQNSKATISFLEEVKKRFQGLKKIKSDNGSHFSSRETQEYSRNSGLVWYFSKPYSPNTQGTVERAHQELKSLFLTDVFRLSREICRYLTLDELNGSLAEALWVLNHGRPSNATDEIPADLHLCQVTDDRIRDINDKHTRRHRKENGTVIGVYPSVGVDLYTLDQARGVEHEHQPESVTVEEEVWSEPTLNFCLIDPRYQLVSGYIMPLSASQATAFAKKIRRELDVEKVEVLSECSKAFKVALNGKTYLIDKKSKLLIENN